MMTVDGAAHGLHLAWAQLAAEAGIDPARARQDYDGLARRYGEPARAYHTLGHVAAVLDHVGRLVAAGEPAADLWAVRAAVWFHDAVYQPAAGDNEEASARLASEVLTTWGVPDPRRRGVEELVRLTASHEPDRASGVPAADARLVCDADLAVLAGAPSAYDAYALAIRTEYGHVDDGAYRRGRRAFLAAMLARPRIYHTATMAHSEAAARQNLRRELDELAGRA